ncbi:4-hydroxy-tetrahydrodipicolinate reductase [Avrilella dinanensis]|uniref:4-hydroxy-tetrahydrodipicolinate reductase n=1 Tax=Avrilella dinanensis TaxID=2008672 RepID=A0A2M9R2M6_9FLAO|nr:4-hydroxy-tetrahydrodipicolinate reductase [Avrilella dinanensis]PJR03035.1 4-hydroxy-tetrahydrodipicolinate reductase [Avrilella dinanensis]
MKIALLGYGKMGQEIEKIATARGHEVILRKTENNNFDGLKNADVAIDFSVPTAAITNISAAINDNVPVVSGTTGWLDDYGAITELCQNKNGAFLYASNFSLGVNIFFELNKKLAQLINQTDGYRVEVEEIHHTQKLDAPSGTAITLTQDIIANTHYNNWVLMPDEVTENDIPITAKRIEKAPGTHSITYTSEVDKISIEHEAFSRQGFALGAVIAAEWLIGKKGVFSMKDVLGLGN